MMEVVAPGPFTTVQDFGRLGYAHLGVSPSGALDVPAFRLANRLVGNPEQCAVLEATYGGLAFRLTRQAWIAVTGAPVAVSVDGRGGAMNCPVLVPPGREVRLGMPRQGIRSYVAVTGGFAVAAVLGSRSCDTLSGIGPSPLRAGDLLPLGSSRPAPAIDVAAVADPPAAGEATILGVFVGPRHEWFAEEALAALFADNFEVTDKSDRVGLRLLGPALLRRTEEELPTEAMMTGSLQVPPDGQPILFLNDHPTTGGYPVIAVVCTADLALVAQARPGTRLRFRQVG